MCVICWTYKEEKRKLFLLTMAASTNEGESNGTNLVFSWKLLFWPTRIGDFNVFEAWKCSCWQMRWHLFICGLISKYHWELFWGHPCKVNCFRFCKVCSLLQCSFNITSYLICRWMIEIRNVSRFLFWLQVVQNLRVVGEWHRNLQRKS